jgi:cytosine/adenosine deaminase-related metal-dependent hydrolase
LILQARWIVPVNRPAIPHGALVCDAGRLIAVGPANEVLAAHPGPVIDLGDTLVFPGLVNAHCHLEYTGLAGLLTPPRTFPDWIKGILAAKSNCSDAELDASWRLGAQQLLASGTTTVVNIESMTTGLAERRAHTPLRVHSHVELTGVRGQKDPLELVANAVELLGSLSTDRGGIGLSPHAPYSTLPALLEAAAAVSRNLGWPLSSHLAESWSEFEMFMYRRGPMFDWLHAQRPCEDCGLGSPIQHAARHGLLGTRLLAIHANYLWNDDASRLAASGSTVVHCPRSHEYFRHLRFPSDVLTAAGVNLCLGTDSLASVRTEPGQRPVLSLFDELAMLSARDATLDAETCLRLVTVNGARALGLTGEIGELSPGARADLVVLPAAALGLSPEEAFVAHRGPVLATLIGGEWAWIHSGWALPAPSLP